MSAILPISSDFTAGLPVAPWAAAGDGLPEATDTEFGAVGTSAQDRGAAIAGLPASLTISAVVGVSTGVRVDLFARASAGLANRVNLRINSTGWTLLAITDGSEATVASGTVAQASGVVRWDIQGDRHIIAVEGEVFGPYVSQAIAGGGGAGFLLHDQASLASISITDGSRVTRGLRQTTGRIYVQPPAGGGWIDLGNVSKLKADHQVDHSEIISRRGGVVRQAGELVKKVDWRWSATLDEWPAVNLELFLRASGVSSDQVEVTDHEWAGVVHPAANRVVSLPHMGLTAWSYTGAGSPVYGVDYTVSSPDGTVTVLTDYWASRAFEITYSAPVLSLTQYAALAVLSCQVSFRIEESDADDPVPREIVTGSGGLVVTAAVESSGEEPAKVEIQLRATGAIAHQMRANV